MKDYAAFLLKLLALSSILTGFIYFSWPSIPVQFRYEHVWALLILFTVVTALFHAGILWSVQKGDKNFVRYYMAATGGKLFLFMSVIVIYAISGAPDTTAFIICFFGLYIIYTAFEVSLVYRKLSSPNL